MNDSHKPFRTINSVAPTRICDNGGWTDTWFAGQGRIFNIAVYPYAEVQVEVFPRRTGADPITIFAENYGDRYTLADQRETWVRHPLLEAAIEAVGVPKTLSIRVSIFSEMPAGASTGTSAAVTVALIGALDRLSPGRLTPHEIAIAAQRIETERLGQQCGIQDQLAAAYGGINFIEMPQYPWAYVSGIEVPNSIWWELERRLVLIFPGKSHRSSDVHQQVIRELENAGPDCQRIEDLRQTAALSRDALYAGDFEGLGRAMVENTDAQGRLSASLISRDAQSIISIARAHGAVGWKVNGAGGEGGSVTLLCNALSHVKRSMIRAIEHENPLYRNIPIYLSRQGLRVWEGQTAATETVFDQRNV